MPKIKTHKMLFNQIIEHNEDNNWINPTLKNSDVFPFFFHIHLASQQWTKIINTGDDTEIISIYNRPDGTTLIVFLNKTIPE